MKIALFFSSVLHLCYLATKCVLVFPNQTHSILLHDESQSPRKFACSCCIGSRTTILLFKCLVVLIFAISLFDVTEQRNPERSSENNFYRIMKPKSESRALFGFNYLASMILSSLTLSSTSTSYTTTTSTITAATLVTCFTSTMFTDTTACRRKRDADSSLLVGDNDDEYLNIPLSRNNMETFELPREGRDIDPFQSITSSQNEENAHTQEFVENKPTDLSVVRYFRKHRNIVISFTITSTLTSYSVYYSSSTRTVNNLATSSALSCLPSGFSLC